MRRLLGVMDMLIIWIVLMDSYVYMDVKTIKIHTSEMCSLPKHHCWEHKAVLQEKTYQAVAETETKRRI